MTTFDTVRDVAAVMRHFPGQWWFAGGWAIDLFAGRVTREHHDVEVGLWRADQSLLQAAHADFQLRKCVDGRWSDWPPDDPINLPTFQLSADSEALRFDLFLDDAIGNLWTFRRDCAITLAIPNLIHHSADGFPFLAPEVQLLYKAKHHRPQDDADFELVLPLLTPEAHRWLRQALLRHQPDDPWLPRLTG